jgi:hypothetical protein
MATVREGLVAAIREVVGDTAEVIDFEDSVDTLGKVTITVRQKRLSPLPEAPNGAMLIEYALTVASPALDVFEAEAELDAFVPSFLDDMRPHSWFAWTEAVKNSEYGQMGYDIDARVLGTPTGEERP